MFNFGITEILQQFQKGVVKGVKICKKGRKKSSSDGLKTIVEHAQELVYNLLCLVPSGHKKASLNALLGLFLETQGHRLPQHTQLKSASSLSRFLNHYCGSGI